MLLSTRCLRSGLRTPNIFHRPSVNKISSASTIAHVVTPGHTLGLTSAKRPFLHAARWNQDVPATPLPNDESDKPVRHFTLQEWTDIWNQKQCAEKPADHKTSTQRLTLQEWKDYLLETPSGEKEADHEPSTERFTLQEFFQSYNKAAQAALELSAQQIRIEWKEHWNREANEEKKAAHESHSSLTKELQELKHKADTLESDLSAAQQLAASHFKELTDLREILQKVSTREFTALEWKGYWSKKPPEEKQVAALESSRRRASVERKAMIENMRKNERALRLRQMFMTSEEFQREAIEEREMIEAEMEYRSVGTMRGLKEEFKKLLQAQDEVEAMWKRIKPPKRWTTEEVEKLTREAWEGMNEKLLKALRKLFHALGLVTLGRLHDRLLHDGLNAFEDPTEEVLDKFWKSLRNEVENLDADDVLNGLEIFRQSAFHAVMEAEREWETVGCTTPKFEILSNALHFVEGAGELNNIVGWVGILGRPLAADERAKVNMFVDGFEPLIPELLRKDFRTAISFLLNYDFPGFDKWVGARSERFPERADARLRSLKILREAMQRSSKRSSKDKPVNRGRTTVSNNARANPNRTLDMKWREAMDRIKAQWESSSASDPLNARARNANADYREALEKRRMEEEERKNRPKQTSTPTPARYGSLTRAAKQVISQEAMTKRAGSSRTVAPQRKYFVPTRGKGKGK